MMWASINKSKQTPTKVTKSRCDCAEEVGRRIWHVKFCHVAHRYLGEEDDGSVSKESRSQALLAKLQQKAKDKQKQSLTERRQHLPEEQTEQQDVNKKRKADTNSSEEFQHHKKRKSEVVPLFVLDSNNHDEATKEKKNKKGVNEKQKKKKKHQSGVFLSTVTGWRQTRQYIHS